MRVCVVSVAHDGRAMAAAVNDIKAVGVALLLGSAVIEHHKEGVA